MAITKKELIEQFERAIPENTKIRAIMQEIDGELVVVLIMKKPSKDEKKDV